MGLNVKYTKEVDQCRTDYKKNKQRASKAKVQDEADAVLDTNHGLVKKRDGTGHYTATKNESV